MIHRLRVVDVETSALEPPPVGEIVEIATVDIDRAEDGTFSIGRKWSMLVKPIKPIPPEASAVHHITDEDVADAPELDDVIENAYGSEVVAFVAHNSRFDAKFFDAMGKPWIDTYRVSLSLWPEAPNHKNFTLWYWLSLNRVYARPMAAHRAGADALVTAQILIVMLGQMRAREMVDISCRPALLPKVTFGEYRGKPWSTPPTSYIDWILRTDFDDEDVVYTANHEMELRRMMG